MKRENGYNTRQRNEILDFLKNNASRHLTADDITAALSGSGCHVGKSTVYRYMEKLVNEGRVRKYLISNSQSACYEYIDENHTCGAHYHFKCTSCGHLLHVDCSMMDAVFEHMRTHHGFEADGTKTVVYGLCKNCRSGGTNDHSQEVCTKCAEK